MLSVEEKLESYARKRSEHTLRLLEEKVAVHFSVKCQYDALWRIFYQQTLRGPFPPSTILANTFIPCMVSANCRQTMSPYGSELTCSSKLQSEQDWFCVILGIPRQPSDQHPSLSCTSVYILLKYTVFYRSPTALGGEGTVVPRSSFPPFLGRSGNEAMFSCAAKVL